MIKFRIFSALTGAAVLVGMLVTLFGFTSAFAQEEPAVIGDLALVKYVCPTDVGVTGTAIPALCADANDPNGADVPVIPVNGAVSFIYQVTYTCRPGVICEPLNPISVTISDNQLPTTTPTVYGPQLDANSNGLIDAGDIWLYKVNGLQAIDLAAATTLPFGTPAPGCAAAPDAGGSRPTYVNRARVTGPSASQEDPAAYCNPPATPTPTLTATPTGTASPTPTFTPAPGPGPRPTDSPARPVPIPEPVTMVLFGTGLAALSAALAVRKRSGK